ncbi:MAG: hypothetical protein ABW123_12150 [Cystobacter sp.]
MSSLLKAFLVAGVLLSSTPGGADAPRKAASVVVKSFRELAKTKKGTVVQLHVAPTGVVADSPGFLYAEPCDPKDPAIQARTGLVGTVMVEDIPQPTALAMNTRNAEEFSTHKAITCYRVEARLKSNQKGETTLAFISAEPSGSRPYDARLDPSRGG